MKKIIVAGCGHGGLSAAARLSKNGYDVTVYEKKSRDALGYDWHDSMRKSTFETADIPFPGEDMFLPMENRTYSNPNKAVKLFIAEPESNDVAYIDRRFLIHYLVEYAESCGVKIKFGCEAVAASHDKNGVTGLTVCEKGRTVCVNADLVIDACGMFSPIRRSLPINFGIQNEISFENTFCVWRGYLESKDSDRGSFDIYFYHCDNPGMDWAIKKDGYYDIMIGGFGKLGEKEVASALEDFYSVYPDMTEKIVRGGAFGKIPVGKTLPVLVCDGYALVGDSAAMTEPLSGSGIDMSIRAGKMLADTVIECDDMKKETLWKYNRRFFRELAEKSYNDAVIKSFLASVTARDIDFFFEKKILTEKEISGGGKIKYSVIDILQKGNVLKKPRLILPLMNLLSGMTFSSKAKKLMPDEYDEAQIEKFRHIYSGF